MSTQLDPAQIIKQAYNESEQAIQVDVISGNITITESAVASNGGLLPAEVKVVAGYDGSNVQVIKTNPAGELQVDVLSSALPTGASTSALQTTGNTSLSSIDTKTPALVAGRTPVDGSGVTQPISAVALPLPSGAATSANQSTEIASLASLDSKAPALGQALAAASVPVVLPASQIATLTPLSSVTVTQATGTNLHTVVDSSALPTGASTSTLQTTGNTSLSSIDTKTPSLGQALAAASVPVVLPAAQISTLTPLSSVTVTQSTGTNLHTTVDNFPATQPISGTVTANAGTGNFSVIQPTGTNLHVITDAGSTTAASQSGQWDITNITGVITLPTGAATQSTLGTLSTNIANRLAGNLVPFAFDFVLISYVPSGNGTGEISTVVYKTGGSGGTTVATLTLAYDSSNRLSSVTKS